MGEGVFAERLIGQIIAGTDLTITTADNSFTVNENGVTIDGMKLTITNGGIDETHMNSAFVDELRTPEGVLQENELYNGVQISSANGLVTARSDGKVRTILNATDGIKIQSHSGVSWVDKIYADTNGKLKVEDVDVSGNINCSSLKINGINALTTDNKISVSAIEDLVVGGNVTMGANATISWANVDNQPFIPRTAYDVGARPDTWVPTESQVVGSKLTKITSTGVYTGVVEAGQITANTLSAISANLGTVTAGKISSNTEISVGTDLFAGGTINVDGGNFAAFKILIDGTTRAEVSYDPGANTLHLINPTGVICANGQQIDVPPVAVFG